MTSEEDEIDYACADLASADWDVSLDKVDSIL